MKKLLILFIFCLAGLAAFPQLQNVAEYRVQDATTMVGINIPVGTKIYDMATGNYYVVTSALTSTATITSGAASLQRLNSDEQDLSLSGDTLSLTGDTTTVDLSGYLDNTDSQTLTFTSPSLSISGGNSVNLSSLQDGTGTDDQTASEVSYTNTTSGLAATTVQAAIDEIDAGIDSLLVSGGDNWGTQTVVSDSTLNGSGTSGSPLTVNSSVIATVASVNSKQDALVSGTNIKTINSTSLLGSGDISITGNATHTGEVTGSTTLTIADGVVDYGNVATTLKDTLVDNDLAWDYSTAGIIYSSITGGGTISLSNAQINKTLCVVLTISSFTSITVPSNVKVLAGSADFATGTFYLYLHCIGTNSFILSITQEAT